MDLSISALAWACAGGFIPALFWLWFWLKEDDHPEPHRLILYAFLGGMLVVPIAGMLQGVIKDLFFVNSWSLNFNFLGTPYVIPSIIILYTLWAGVEEVLKLFAAMFTGLVRKEDDEPIDPSIYLLTAALGFACLENILFVIDPINSGNYTLSILTGNVRFVGATLLHLLSSASIGVAVGLVFYKPLWVKGVRTFLGLILATLLHTLFNLLIMRNDPYTTVIAFLGVWILIIALAVFFEKLKNIKKPQP